MIDLKDYVCVSPFEYLEVTSHGGIYGCCPGWLQTQSAPLEKVSTVWESERHKEIQNSMLDGSYKFCSTEHCPALNQLVNKGILNKKFFKKRSEFKPEQYKSPRTINYAFDRSCNLSCPSCRENVIMANGVELEKIEWVMSEIEKTYGKDLQRIYLSGSAEPFASKSFRKLLTNFDKTKYPKVYDIQLHTNGTLFNQKMWEDMKEIQGMIKVIEISIDAATKETYQKIRRGGNWEDLMDNLNFLKTLPMGFILSMVVQDTNYKEMELFYNNMINLFDNKGSVFFKKITNWKTYSENEFKTKEIFNPTHSNFNDFLLELSKIDNKPNCSHNFHDIIVEHGSYKTKLI